ncbi:MAG: nucleotidyltransferase domain-containing protein [Calditrichaeota bacterium]|nr:MAG: nucleotidyltransferase domain-containing protein [Calditrichota bacterium]
MAKNEAQKLIFKKIRKYIKALEKNHIRCDKVFLFGSYAKGNYTRHSDIDLAVVSNDLTGNMIDDQVLLMKYTHDIDLRIEPHPFLPSEFTPDNPFVKHILETGIEMN